MDENLKEFANIAEGAVTELYKDVASPSIQPIGTMLSYLPRTIRLAFTRWEKWIINGEESLKLTGELLRERVQNIPDEKLCEPEPYVAIPAIQQLSYCENSDILRELYANLLASSMNIDTKWTVHPSFVDIIKQLNPDEAKLLKSLTPATIINHPLIDVRLKNKHDGGSHLLFSNFTTVGLNKIENESNIHLYIDNLERLKLIEIPPLQHLVDKMAYDELKKHPFLKELLNVSGVNPHFDIDYEHKTFNLTSFGVSFIQVSCNR
jgi:hypothetical protein